MNTITLSDASIAVIKKALENLRLTREFRVARNELDKERGSNADPVPKSVRDDLTEIDAAVTELNSRGG